MPKTLKTLAAPRVSKLTAPAKSKPPKITPATYERFKRFIIRTERDNFDSIYVTPCAGDKGWLEIGDHSALFYYYEALSTRTRKPKFTFDTFSGYYIHYEIGHISIRQLDDVIHTLKTASLLTSITHLDASGRPTNSQIHITRLKLNHTYAESEVFALERKEQKRREQALRVPRINTSLPDLYLDLVNAITSIRRLACRSLNAPSKITLCHTITNQCDAILRGYLEANTLLSLVGDTKRTNPSHYFEGVDRAITIYQALRSEVYRLITSIQMAYIYQYIESISCCVFHDQLTSINERVTQLIKTLQSDKAKYEQNKKSSKEYL